MSKYESNCACGKVKEKKAKKCARCSNIENSPSKKKLPTDDVVLLMLTKKSAAQVARDLGVSLTTIRNIKLKYNR